MEQLRKLELKRADYVKTEKTRKEVEKFESQMTVASQAIETTSAEITKLRENELFPQLLKLVEGSVFPCFFIAWYHTVQNIKEESNWMVSLFNLDMIETILVGQFFGELPVV